MVITRIPSQVKFYTSFEFAFLGDTVNTAARLESTGEPLKIQVSEATKLIFDKFGTFRLQLRGDIELKGKGTVTTYWLCECSEKPRPPTPLKCHVDSEANPFPILFPSIK